MSPDSPRPAPLLSASGITRYFASSGVLANDDISLSVEGGEILALVGENGAGKSTFARVVAGMLVPDKGRVAVRGREIRPGSVRGAEGAGIGLVPQHSFLAASLSLAEALALGREPRRFGLFFDRRRAWAEAAELCERHSLGLDPEAIVGRLSAAERRQAEILRVLAWGGDVLLLDEPTSLLTESESSSLFDLIRSLAAHGKAIVFISHRVAELRSIATRIAVLRNGRLVADRAAADYGPGELPLLMSRAEAAKGGRRGREVPKVESSAPPRATVLEIEGLALPSAQGRGSIDLSVRAGECLAVLALAGNGLEELEGYVAGIARPAEGRVRIGGEDPADPRRARFRAEVLGYVPSDREGAGLSEEASAADNLLVHERFRLGMGDWLSPRRRREAAGRLLSSLGPRGDLGAPAGTLSGGNRQRLVLSRELGGGRAFLLLADPSQSLDIEGSEELADIIEGEKAAGAAILLLSSSIEEALRLADRIAVLYRGLVAWTGEKGEGDLPGELTARLTGMAAGQNPAASAAVEGGR